MRKKQKSFPEFDRIFMQLDNSGVERVCGNESRAFNIEAFKHKMLWEKFCVKDMKRTEMDAVMEKAIARRVE